MSQVQFIFSGVAMLILVTLLFLLIEHRYNLKRVVTLEKQIDLLFDMSKVIMDAAEENYKSISST